MATTPSTTPVVPNKDPVVEDKTRIVRPLWQTFFNQLLARVLASSPTVGSAADSAQSAAVPPTAISTSPIGMSLYRVSYRMRVTTAAGATSSLTMTIAWTEGGVACSQAFAALTSNDPSLPQSGAVPLLAPDAGTDITYEIAYSSTGIPAMEYDFDVALELVPA